ncbi:MAG: glutamine-hydrolyzing carbamoyl-phosphate synthase small subunit [Maricaulaceae bacterium]
MPISSSIQDLKKPLTGALAFADGRTVRAFGCGAVGQAVGEVCFNTAMTGYQEVLCDPSYADQIVCFTFPHIGVVGANSLDEEAASPPARAAARGVIMHARPNAPSNWRTETTLDAWLKARGLIGLYGVDTRALTAILRDEGAINAVIAHDPEGAFDWPALTAQARDWAGLVQADLANAVTTPEPMAEATGTWSREHGFAPPASEGPLVAVIDYGVKANIVRCLNAAGCRTVVLPASSALEAVLTVKPAGVVLSNGPGDPAATYANGADTLIKGLLGADIPIFGICLGHQMLALALGARTIKMNQGHHGANHPVKHLETGQVEIVSMNHGFTVDADSLPDGVRATHVSLFDGTNCGLRVEGKPVSSVQHHPEASPGPRDSFYIFKRFAESLGVTASDNALALA